MALSRLRIRASGGAGVVPKARRNVGHEHSTCRHCGFRRGAFHRMRGRETDLRLRKQPVAPVQYRKHAEHARTSAVSLLTEERRFRYRLLLSGAVRFGEIFLTLVQ